MRMRAALIILALFLLVGLGVSHVADTGDGSDPAPATWDTR